ncbi:MAG: type II secretion system inner membrane protein GspF [Desulfobacterales bacterium]|nr:type II secretion system inner membrane protein GspF [Desulfobacterales bacterium]
MPIFEYTALDVNGKQTSGIIDSDSPATARQKLRAAKSYPISIKEVQEEHAQKHASPLIQFQRPFSRIKPSEITMMTRQLATLISAGFPLVSALYSLIPQCSSKALRNILSQVKDAIEEGNTFANSLSKYPECFSSIYVNMVRAGETSGTLEIVLERLADITEKKQAITNKIKSALAYPIFMAILGVTVLFILLTYIVPNIISIFNEMNQVLPTPTRILIRISDVLKSYGWLLILVIFGVSMTFLSIKQKPKVRQFLDKTKLRIPFFANLIKKLSTAQFCRTLGSLLENGVSMITALDIVKNIVGNTLIAEAIDSAAKEVEKGISLGNSLENTKMLPILAIQMIKVGEQSGNLENMLYKVSDVFDNEVETTIIGMTTLLEPMIILILGIVVGFIVLSICLPIFEMNQLVSIK